MLGPLENHTNVILSKLCSVVYGDNVISRADGFSKRKEAGKVGGRERGLNKTWIENKLDAGELMQETCSESHACHPFPEPIHWQDLPSLIWPVKEERNTMPALSISREDNTCKVNTQIHKILGTVKMGLLLSSVICIHLRDMK